MVTEERDRDDAGPPGGEWLLARARAGDEEAFSRLIDENMDYVYAIACKFVRNPSDAEDITQEVFEKLGKALKSFDGRSAFRSWLYTITLNSVRDYVRATARRGRKRARTQASRTPMPCMKRWRCRIGSRGVCFAAGWPSMRAAISHGPSPASARSTRASNSASILSPVSTG